jgi:radical SAM protein with 4Fe4S-binding SPASM domain
MDPKKLLTNKSICVLPWTGFELDPGGFVKNCIMSKEYLGNIKDNSIKEILAGKKNTDLKEAMLKDQQPKNCQGCYLQEKNRSDLSSISSRLYYLKELAAKTDISMYDNKENFSLKHVDLRWTNSCNQACVYCEPMLSSKWAQELGTKISYEKETRQDVKKFVFDNIAELENVYLAGGEPMLMKENLEFLQLLKEKNPKCSIRINTNLSTTKTGIFDLACSFPNVHWTVSIETIEKQYEYVRYHGSWKEFTKNLMIIKKLDHKISFNMLHFILNHTSLFECVDYLKGMGFHDNSFIIGPLTQPFHLNMLNLPYKMLDQVIKKLRDQLELKPEGYLKNSYENLLAYYTTTSWDKNISEFYKQTKIMDQRRGNDCRKTFPLLFEELDAETLG